MKASVFESPLASLARVRLVAGQTLAAALHLRLTLLLVLVGAAVVAGARGLAGFNFGPAELKFIGDFGLAVVGLFGAVLAALATAQLFFAELVSGAALCLLARSLRRSEFIGGRLAGMIALLALFAAALGGLLAALLAWRARELGLPAVGAGAWACACALQWLKLTLVSAMTLFVCSFATNALFASSAGLLLAGAAQLRDFAMGPAVPAFLRLWPNLGVFDAEAVLAGERTPEVAWLVGVGVYWAAYVMLFGGLAAFLFRRRDL